jgi:hypothetical protein
MADFTIKQGETFTLLGTFVEDDDVTPKSLSGVTLTSHIRDKNYNLIDELTVTVLDENAGTYKLQNTSDTLIWKHGIHLWDIKTEYSPEISISETKTIEVLKAITHV